MATLQEIQKVEREKVSSLSASINRNAADLKSLMEILTSAESFGMEPLRHIKAAMVHYCKESHSNDI